MKNAKTEEEMSFVETFVSVSALVIGLIVIGAGEWLYSRYFAFIRLIK